MKFFFSFISIATIIQFIWLQQNKPLKESITRGNEIYNDFCVQCHLDNGEGVAGIFPPLSNSDYLLNNIRESIYGIKYGMEGPITVNGELYDGIMVSQGLDNEEIADVMNYILNSWENSYNNEIITPSLVNEIKK
ncbi:MAG: cytochrome C [Flavobacteriaceae bacterium]|nr:cytochrome C [Flavobacteriaceae bacterium]|tara:strand:- start:137 stop:541 length:405 start_codon:yes stop_codon:yes gene_type:complete